MPKKLLDALFQKVSFAVTPEPSEATKEKKLALKLVSLLEPFLPPGTKVFFVGSTARDTGLRGDRDIDLFACFPQSFSREQIVSLTATAIKKNIPGKWVMHYAEHPYYQSIVEGYAVEVIPCFQINANAPLKSAVDRSPLHMDYLQKRLSSLQKRDVRVLKQLLKTHGIYGAEASIGGFSGLLCEYLILNYRSLEKLLSASSAWFPPVLVDIEGAYSGKTPKELSEKFGNAPLVVVDAIDSNRNAAAAVSQDSLACFASLSHALLSRPSEKLFFKQPLPKVGVEKLLSKRQTTFVLLEFALPRDLVEDVFAPQLKKTCVSLATALSSEGFRLVGNHHDFDSQKAVFLFESLDACLPAVRQHRGPPAFMHAACKKFVASHPKPLRGPFVEEGRLIVEELGRQETFESVAAKLLSSQKISIGPSIEKQFRKATFVEAAKAQGIARTCLEAYLTKKAGWL